MLDTRNVVLVVACVDLNAVDNPDVSVPLVFVLVDGTLGWMQRSHVARIMEIADESSPCTLKTTGTALVDHNSSPSSGL